MKKVYLAIIAILASAGIASAQDLASAVEKFNSGSAALSNGNKIEAISCFKAALEEANMLEDSEDKATLVENCNNTLPKLVIYAAKDLFAEGKYDEAVAMLEEAKVLADKCNQFDCITEANNFIPQFLLQKANTLLKAKDYASASVAFQDVLSKVDSTSAHRGTAALGLGNSLKALGDMEGAVAAYEVAASAGKAKDATKNITNIYLVEAQKLMKANKYKEAIATAEKVNAYAETPAAYKIIGGAYQKLGDNNSAIENFEKYIAIAGNAKDVPQITYAVAALYQKAGKKAKAIEYYQKVVTDPQFGASATQQLQALTK